MRPNCQKHDHRGLPASSSFTVSCLHPGANHAPNGSGTEKSTLGVCYRMPRPAFSPHIQQAFQRVPAAISVRWRHDPLADNAVPETLRASITWPTIRAQRAAAPPIVRQGVKHQMIQNLVLLAHRHPVFASGVPLANAGSPVLFQTHVTEVLPAPRATHSWADVVATVAMIVSNRKLAVRTGLTATGYHERCGCVSASRIRVIPAVAAIRALSNLAHDTGEERQLLALGTVDPDVEGQRGFHSEALQPIRLICCEWAKKRIRGGCQQL